MKIEKEIYLEKLPKYGGIEGRIKWDLCSGMTVKFKYSKIEGEIEILSYDKKKLTIKYKNNQYIIGTDKFKNCEIGKIIGVFLYQHKYKIGDIITTNNRTLKILDLLRLPAHNNTNQDWTMRGYKYQCNICNYISTIAENSLTRGCGCPVCADQIVSIGINDMWTTNPEQASWLLNPEDGYKYMKSVNKSFDWKCPKCGDIIINKTANAVNRNGLACKKCSDGISYPNKFILHLLEQIHFESDGEVTYTWSKNYIYDRVIEQIKLIIEMDGKFHSIDNYLSGQTKEESKLIDDEKDSLATKNGYSVLRIDCCYNSVNERFNYIKNSVINLLKYSSALENLYLYFI